MNFNALREELRTIPQKEGVPACAMVVKLGRETVLETCENTEPDRLYWLYSATKVFTAVLFGRMLERGELRLEDRVSDYLPEFGEMTVMDADGRLREAGGAITLQLLSSMCSGMTYDIFSPHIREAKDRTTVGIVREMAKMPLAFDPGDSFLYSLSHDVLAAVMELRSGRRYSELMREEILAPLGMENTGFHPTDAQRSRFAPQYQWREHPGRAEPCGMDNKFCFSDDYDSGGAGLFSCLGDTIRLPEALACGGRGRDGYPLLKPETIDALRLNRLTERQRRGFDSRWGARNFSYGYGLGVRTRVDQKDGSAAPTGEFGWDGAAGAYVLIDPSRQLSAFYVQHVLDMGKIFDRVHPRLRELVYAGLDA